MFGIKVLTSLLCFSFSVFLLLADCCTSSAQCALKMSELPQAPELFGFRLGMMKDDIKTLVPQTKFSKNDEFGVTKTTINPSFDKAIDQKMFEGVRSISLDLLDNKLTSLWIGFDETYKAQSIEEFLPLISQALHLPQGWSSWKGRGQQMRCADFQVVVTTVARAPSFRIVDVSADDIIAARRQEKEDRDTTGGSTTEDDTPQDIVGDKVTKSFYPAGCPSAKDVSVANRIVFRTVEDAEKAGFKLSKSCH